MKIEINIDDRLIERVKAFLTRRNVIVAFTIMFVMSLVVIKAAVTLNVFEANTPIKSYEINENFANLQAQIDAHTAQININTPAGTIIAFAGANVPDGWLLCNGSAVSRSDYSVLFAAISTAWGDGNGSTTFNLPDLRGRFLRGVDGTAGNDLDKGTRTANNAGNSGNNVGSYQGDAIRNIVAFANAIGTSHFGGATGAFQYAAVSHGSGWDNNGSSETFYHLYFDASQASGVQVGSDNRPKNAYVNYIIKAN